MADYQLGVIEARFADIIWNNEPLSSTQLCRLAEEQLTWKKSTTYTVLRRLCQKGIFQNENGVVSAKLSKDEFYAGQSGQYVEENFGGSLPLFLAAFTKHKKLTSEEVDELRRMIDSYGE